MAGLASTVHFNPRMDTFRTLFGGCVAVVTFLLASSVAPIPASPSHAAADESCVGDPESVTESPATVVRTIMTCREELGLSREQSERLDRLTAGFLEDHVPRQRQIFVLESQLAMLLRVDPRDPAKPIELTAAEAKVREIGKLLTEADVAALRAVEAGKAVLTAAQRAKLAGLVRSPEPAQGDDAPASPRYELDI